MMSLLVQMLIKNKDEVSNPSVKKPMLLYRALLVSC